MNVNMNRRQTLEEKIWALGLSIKSVEDDIRFNQNLLKEIHGRDAERVWREIGIFRQRLDSLQAHKAEHERELRELKNDEIN